MGEVKGYAYGGFTYCTDCAPVLDSVLLTEGDPITDADLSTRPYGCACDECHTIIICPDDAEFELLLQKLGAI